MRYLVACGFSNTKAEPAMPIRYHTGDMSPDMAAKAKWWAQINVGIAGDVGPFTCWTTKHGKVVFIRRAPPDKPASPAQMKMRLRFRLAFMNWKALDKETQERWRTIVNNNKLCLSAHNLFMSLSLTPDPQGLAEKAEAAGVTVTHPEHLGP